MAGWQDLAVPADAPQAAPAAGAPSWQSLGAPVPEEPAPNPNANESNQEKAYRLSQNMGWLGKIYAASGAFHDQMLRTISMGLSDKVAGLEPAALHAAAKGVNALYDGIGADKPFPEAENENFSDVYHDNLARSRAASERYSQDHPYASTAAKALGIAASVPLMSGAGATGLDVPLLPTVGRTLGAKIGQGALTGAEIGGIAGFGQSNDESLKKDAVATGVGAGLGGALGAGTTLIGEKVVAPIANWVAGKFGADAVENAGTKQILDRIANSESGGGPSAQDMLDLIRANSGKPLMLADVGGAPVQGLGERIANAPGAGRQVAETALTGRDAGAGQRIAQELGDTLGAGNSNFSTAQALTQARAAAAAPAYEAAGIPSDPAHYAAAPVVDNPKVTELLTKSKAVQSAISQAKDRPVYADLPDNSIVLLDKAYKNIGGAANAAKISGNSELARDLNGERVALLDAITNGAKDHPYHAALKAFSGPSQSIGALNEGAAFLTKPADEITADLAKLSPNDQEFYRLGAANALKTKVLQTSQGGNEALRITGNNYVKDQIHALAGSKEAAERLINSAGLENTMFQTKANVLGNSRTALRMAEQAAAHPEAGIVPSLVQTAAGAASGEPVVSGMGAFNLGRKIVSAMSRPSPAVDAASARMLFNPNATVNQDTLARIIAMGSKPSMTTALTRPLVYGGAQFLPGQMNMPLLNSGGGQ
jgi:hypothetical protein